MFYAELWAPWLLTLAVYALYCFVWEAATGTTPGKHLLGCRVVDERGGRPTLAQLALRNVLRVAELAAGMVLLFSVFLVLVLSQRRQRIGDVLAGTIVVSGAGSEARPVNPAGRASGPGSGDADGTNTQI
jgi:uncharacterized RDD family membrane protein YckC